MKFKHLFVFTVVFALVTLATSCSKPSEGKIVGKWEAVSLKEHSSIHPEWESMSIKPNSYLEFRSDGTYSAYENGELDESGIWSYNKDNNQLVIDGQPFDITSFSSTQMVLNVKVTYGNEWIETETTLKKMK